MKRKYDDLMFYGAIEHCQSGGRLEDYCKSHGYNLKCFTKALNRRGIKTREIRPTVDPIIVKELIDWFESGGKVKKYATEKNIQYGKLVQELNGAGLRIRHFWSEFRKWEDYVEQYG